MPARFHVLALRGFSPRPAGRTRVGAVLVVALAMMASLGGSLPASQAATKSFVAQHSISRPLVGEKVRLSGNAEVKRRTVALQILTSGTWTGAGKVKTGKRGAFAFTVRAAASKSSYRFYAKRLKVGGKTYAPRYSQKFAVTPVPATATLRIAAAPVGRVNSTGGSLTPGTAAFTPARSGAPVTIEKLVAGSWRAVLSGTQNAAGRFGFQVEAGSAGSPFQFRARSLPVGGGRTIYSEVARSGLWALAWQDEFAGSGLGSEWRHRPVNDASGVRDCATGSAEQTTVSKGAARLAVAVNTAQTPNVVPDCPMGQFLNAMVGTEGNKQFKYGLFAARIKFQKGQGQHGAFWLQAGAPTGQANQPAVNGAEVDVAEYFGDGYGSGRVGSFIHWWGSSDVDGNRLTHKIGKLHNETKQILGGTASDGYHVYSVEWTPSEYIVRLDGVETFRTTQAVSQREQFIVLSLLTSDWELPKLDKEALPSAMSVDWVRVWQAK